MDRQALRDWVRRYNAEGIAGLKSGHGPGKPPSLNREQMAELKAMVLKGPDPEKHGVGRWRCVDLHTGVARRYSVEVSKRTVGKWLRKMKLTRLHPWRCDLRFGVRRTRSRRGHRHSDSSVIKRLSG